MYVCYRFAEKTVVVLGEDGINVVVRLSAFILMCIGIEICGTAIARSFRPSTRSVIPAPCLSSDRPLPLPSMPFKESLHVASSQTCRWRERVAIDSRILPIHHCPYLNIEFRATERPARAAYDLVHDELLLDGNSRQNLATFCTTWAEPEVRALMAECMDKNMCDKDEYPQTAEIESRCVHMLADLWNSPDAANTIGCSTTGSSEAAMLGGLAAKWRWRCLRACSG